MPGGRMGWKERVSLDYLPNPLKGFIKRLCKSSFVLYKHHRKGYGETEGKNQVKEM